MRLIKTLLRRALGLAIEEAGEFVEDEMDKGRRKKRRKRDRQKSEDAAQLASRLVSEEMKWRGD